jgi:hypothetical protein
MFTGKKKEDNDCELSNGKLSFSAKMRKENDNVRRS